MGILNTVAIIQSNYLPWKGYFDIINDVDTFIFYDTVQYTKNDWRNRNQILNKNGQKFWITVPTGTNLKQRVNEVKISSDNWAKKHWNAIYLNYSKTKYFNKYASFFEDVYLHSRWTHLSELNQLLIRRIATEFLGIQVNFENASDYLLTKNKELTEDRELRLISLLKEANATKYISGSAAKAYINKERFDNAKIQLEYKNYGEYPDYNQFSSVPVHQISIIDLLFNEGPNAPYFIWKWRN